MQRLRARVGWEGRLQDWAALLGILSVLVGGAGAIARAVINSEGGRSSEPAELPEEFVTRVARYFFSGQYERYWDSLHPTDQRIVGGAARYRECQPRPSPLLSITPAGLFTSPVSRPGVSQPDATVVEVRLRLRGELDGGVVTQPVWVTAIEAGGRWVRLLPQQEYEVYSRGGCPNGRIPGLAPTGDSPTAVLDTIGDTVRPPNLTPAD